VREALAFIRQDALSAASYRVSMLFSVVGLVASVIPLYFVANALQGVMGASIAADGGQYFSFVLLGMIGLRFATLGLAALPTALAAAIRNGTLEALFATPLRYPAMLVGMTGYRVLWAVIESTVLATVGAMFGARYIGGHALIAAAAVVLLTLAYAAVGVIAASLLLSFRSYGPLLTLTLGASALLGGVYYPTHVIPSWIQHLSSAMPLTYALRVLRRSLLEGVPLVALSSDLTMLLGMVAVLVPVSLLAFDRALRYAKRAGTLAQY
jgi:ABC-2 type transport system permease protein